VLAPFYGVLYSFRPIGRNDDRESLPVAACTNVGIIPFPLLVRGRIHGTIIEEIGSFAEGWE
jgi:hypothetical protein